MKPEVSVVVPIYNVQAYLKRCLISLENQTFSNIEVILVNDGSTDNSESICQQFVESDKRFKYFKKSNGGLSDARNYGIKRATGKYIVFTDSDDFVEANYIELLYKSAIAKDAEVVICPFFKTNEKGDRLQKVSIEESPFSVSGSDLIKKFYTENHSVVNIVAWNKIYLASIFEKIQFEKGRFFEDEYIFVPLFWNIKRVVVIDEPLYNYVQRPGSIMKTSFSEKKFRDNIDFRNWRISFFQSKDLSLQNYAIQDLKNYLINLGRNKDAQSNMDLKDLKEIQRLYRKLVKLKCGVGIKNKIKDVLGYVNIKML